MKKTTVQMTKVFDELFDIFDKTTRKKIGRERRGIVHQKGLLHKSVSIFVFNKNNELLIQKRANNKDLWDLSVTEHLKENETYESGAIRGLEEELGIKIKNGDLIQVGEEHEELWEFENVFDYELSKTFKCRYDGVITMDNMEVVETRFISLDDIKLKELKFTPWFNKEIKRIL